METGREDNTTRGTTRWRYEPGLTILKILENFYCLILK